MKTLEHRNRSAEHVISTFTLTLVLSNPLNEHCLTPIHYFHITRTLLSTVLLHPTALSLIKFADPLLRGKSEQTYQLTYKKQMDAKDRNSIKDVVQGKRNK